jgi:cation:H+ antiporter
MSTITQELLGDQSIILWTVLGIIGFLVTWKGANVVEESTSKLSKRFGLSQAIQGGIVAAIATSFPELAITVMSVVLLGEFGIGAGALIGTAIFNLLVIPSLVTIITGDTHTNKGIVYRDSIFYVVSILAFFGVVALGVLSTEGTEETDITPIMGIGMIVIYIVYLVLLFNKKKSKEEQEKITSINAVKQAGIMTVALFVVLVGVELMVAMTVELSEAVGAPPFLISVSLLSILSSFPDLLVGIRMGEDDERKAAISNVFGTNTFNLLVVLPIGAIIAGGVSLGFLTAVPLLLFLFYTTLFVVVLAATDFEITQLEAYMLLVLYLLFLLWMGLEALGFTQLLTENTIETIISG